MFCAGLQKHECIQPSPTVQCYQVPWLRRAARRKRQGHFSRWHASGRTAPTCTEVGVAGVCRLLRERCDRLGGCCSLPAFYKTWESEGRLLFSKMRASTDVGSARRQISGHRLLLSRLCAGMGSSSARRRVSGDRLLLGRRGDGLLSQLDVAVLGLGVVDGAVGCDEGVAALYAWPQQAQQCPVLDAGSSGCMHSSSTCRMKRLMQGAITQQPGTKGTSNQEEVC